MTSIRDHLSIHIRIFIIWFSSKELIYIDTDVDRNFMWEENLLYLDTTKCLKLKSWVENRNPILTELYGAWICFAMNTKVTKHNA